MPRFLLLLLIGSVLEAQPPPPPLTQVFGTYYTANHLPINGTVTITWPRFTTQDGRPILSNGVAPLVAKIVNGQLCVPLEPSVTATPHFKYTVTYSFRQNVTEYWDVPAYPTTTVVAAIATLGPYVIPAYTSIPETSVIGLIGDLANRPVKGPLWGVSKVATIASDGTLNAVVGIDSNCVRVDGSSTGCGGGGGGGGGSGTVTAVSMVMPSIFQVTGSPVTTSGTLQAAFNSQAANLFLASPSGGIGFPTFRTMAPADVPLLNQNTTGTAANVTGVVSVVNGGTGTPTPGLLPGTNVTITGTWPNQTITASSTAALAFSAVTGSTNSQAAMHVGTGASLDATGSGTITATAVPYTGITGSPSLVAGAGISVSGTWPNQTVSGTVGAGATIPNTTNLIVGTGTGNGGDSGIIPSTVVTTPGTNTITAARVTGLSPIAISGSASDITTGTLNAARLPTTPTLLAGSNVTITGTWPNQTIAAGTGVAPGTGTFYQQLQANAVAQPQRTFLNFTPEFGLSDNQANDRSTLALASVSWSKVTGAPVFVDTAGIYSNPSWLISLPYSKITSPPILTNTFNGRSGVVLPLAGDYTAAKVTNAVDTTQTYADPAWITSLASTKIVGGLFGSCPTCPGEWIMGELPANGNTSVSWLAPQAIPSSYRNQLPAAAPQDPGQGLICGTPIDPLDGNPSISNCHQAFTGVRGFGVAFDGAGVSLVSGQPKYFIVPYACSVSAANLVLAPSGSATVDIWRVAIGAGANPAVSNSITGGNPAVIPSNVPVHLTALNGWSVSSPANAVYGFNLNAVSGATYVSITLECDQ